MWRRWHRELIDEMREENRRRREEHERWREENRRRREEHERWLVEWRAREEADAKEQKRRFDALDAAMENDKRVTRGIILELREGTAMLRDLRHGIQSNTEGLLRVLDRLDRNDGPSPAGA